MSDERCISFDRYWLSVAECRNDAEGCRICGSSRFTEIPLPLKSYVLLVDVIWCTIIQAFDGNQSEGEFGLGGTSVRGQRRCSKCWLIGQKPRVE